jgi:hypothetical protein
MGWKEHEFFFAASSATATLLFQSLNRGFLGAALENISVSAAPNPAAPWMLGTGLAGLAARHRRHK